MAFKVELPRELLKESLETSSAQRERAAKAASNPVIKQAYEQEAEAFNKAILSLEQAK